MQRRIGGLTHVRKPKCNEKFESLIPHFNYSKIVRGGCFLISFIDVPAKNVKTLKLLLEGDGEKGR